MSTRLPLTDTAPAAASGGASAALARLRGRWRHLLRQFDQRSQRERLLLLSALMALALMAADSLWLGPAFRQFRAARTEQMVARQALQDLQNEVNLLQTDGRQRVQRRQAELADWRARVRDGDAALRRHEDSLVGPDRMVGLLEQLLARHGEVRVRALRSLGRSDLLDPGSTAPGPSARPAPAAAQVAAATASALAGGPARQAAAAALGSAQAGQPPATPVAGSTGVSTDSAAATGLYRHGVELVLEGGFADLLSYLQALEALPQRVLWGSVSLKVEQHPKSVLTLRVYTLSRERHWLEI